MRLSLLCAGAALLLCQSAAMAQTNAPPADNQATPPAPPAANSPAPNTGALRAHVRDMLERSGFTDVRMMPSSFLISAKDRDGNPVVMTVTPNSITAIAEINAAGDNGSPGAAQQPGTSEFVSIDNSDILSSNLVGLDVYNNSNQNIGQIRDIAFGPRGRVHAYIVSVGGFLGLGQRYVALNPSDVKVAYNDSDKKWHATANVNSDQLKAAPQFTYNGRWNASKS